MAGRSDKLTEEHGDFSALLQKTVELTTASAQVIAARLAMAATPQAITPKGQAEFARMVPEKTQAFTEAFDVAGQQWMMLAGKHGIDWLRETSLASTAALSMLRAGTPLTGLLVQQNYLASLCERSMKALQTNAAAINRMQNAVLAPVHKTARENAQRLADKEER